MFGLHFRIPIIVTGVLQSNTKLLARGSHTVSQNRPALITRPIITLLNYCTSITVTVSNHCSHCTSFQSKGPLLPLQKTSVTLSSFLCLHY